MFEGRNVPTLAGHVTTGRERMKANVLHLNGMGVLFT